MIRIWLSTGILTLLAACATTPPTETAVRYGKISQIESVTIDGDHQLGLGAVIGAVAGGVLGHQIGGGSGKDVATVAGVLAGGYVGNKVENRTDRRTGQHVIVQLNNGVAVGITQPANPALQVGDQVRIDGTGSDARVVRP